MSGKKARAVCFKHVVKYCVIPEAQGREIKCKDYGFWSFEDSDVARTKEKGKTREKKSSL